MNINKAKIEKIERVYNEEFDINIKPYLTNEEIVSVAETALDMNNLAEINMAIAYNVILLVTDATEADLDELSIDDIMYGGLWEVVADNVENLEEVYDYIHYEQNASVAVAKFVNRVLPTLIENLDKQLGEYLDNMSTNGVKDISAELEKIMQVVKEDGNAEIIKGAMKLGGENAND